MKYMIIRLKPKFNVLNCTINYHLNPFEERRIPVGNADTKVAIDQILKHALELIMSAYDIQVQVKELDQNDD